MRSSKHPYWLLKNSKNPQVQEWLSKALTMSQDEINLLSIKPDWKKAMLYAKQVDLDAQSLLRATQLANNMKHVDREPETWCIWQYMGDDTWVKTGRISEILVDYQTIWASTGTRARIKHCDVDLANPSLIAIQQNSKLIDQGSLKLVNDHEQKMLALKHPATLQSTFSIR